MDAGDQFVLMERLGHVVVGAKAEALDLVFNAGEPREDESRRLHFGAAQSAQHFEARHVWEIQIKEDDVVVVDLAKIDPFLAEIGGVDIEALGFEHQLERLRGGSIVFNNQYAHASPLRRGLDSSLVRYRRRSQLLAK